MTTWLRMVITLVTVGGGFTGFVGTIQVLTGTPGGLRGAQGMLFLGFAALYAYLVVAGLLFVHNPRRLLPALIGVAIQLPFVSSPAVSYRCSSGFHATVGIVGSNLVAAFRLGSEIQFTLLQPQPWGVGVNLFALLLLILIVRERIRQAAPTTPAPWTPLAP